MNVPKTLFLISCFGLTLCYGIAVGHYHLFPYQLLCGMRDAVIEVREDDVLMRAKIKPTKFLQPNRFDRSGLTKWDKKKAYPGLTFIAGFFDDIPQMRLIRMDGTVVKKWSAPYSRFWPNPQHVKTERKAPQTDWNVDLHGALLLPNGSTIFNFEYCGTVKLSRSSQVEWLLPEMTHHSLELSRDGGFWIPGRKYKGKEEQSDFPPFQTPYAEDFIFKISPEGEVLSRISVPELFFSNDLEGLLLSLRSRSKIDFNSNPPVIRRDQLVHLNDIEELSDDLAPNFPQFAAGDLLLSLNHLYLLMVIDPVSKVVKWHQTGPWIGLHDPDFQADGTITVFNNNMDTTQDGSIFGGSNIMKVDPASGHTKIIYGGLPHQTFYTKIRGKHQVLPNGNILITEFNAGRIFEVDEAGDIVWEFINGYNDEEVAEVTGAIRYPESYFTVDQWDDNEQVVLQAQGGIE